MKSTDPGTCEPNCSEEGPSGHDIDEVARQDSAGLTSMTRMLDCALSGGPRSAGCRDTHAPPGGPNVSVLADPNVPFGGQTCFGTPRLHVQLAAPTLSDSSDRCVVLGRPDGPSLLVGGPSSSGARDDEEPDAKVLHEGLISAASPDPRTAHGQATVYSFVQQMDAPDLHVLETDHNLGAVHCHCCIQ